MDGIFLPELCYLYNIFRIIFFITLIIISYFLLYFHIFLYKKYCAKKNIINITFLFHRGSLKVF